jgi:hypothetical protein
MKQLSNTLYVVSQGAYLGKERERWSSASIAKCGCRSRFSL